MKVIVTGATGMVGKGILLECLDHKDITEVLSISRKSLGLEHPKLKELLHQDFSEFSSVKEQLKGYDACYASMGVSAASMAEDQYYQMTYGFTMALANELHTINPEMTFIYVSGKGTDSTENGKMMWARVKGKTENDILKLGFKQAYMFRPGAIIPKRGVVPSDKMYRELIKYLKWMIKLIKLFSPSSVVNTTQIGLAMIQMTQKGYDKSIIDPKDMLKVLKG